MQLKLYEYQKEYFKNVKPNWIYDCDTGTGKTIMGLNHYKHYFSDCSLLIVAPASKVKEGGWQRTIEDYFPEINYEIVSYNKLPKINSVPYYTFVIFDEVHRLKNSTGKWGKAGFEISQKVKGFIGLSATPIPNGWEDSINYFKMFNKVKNKTAFYNNFCEINRRFGYLQIEGYKNEDVLLDYWKSISKRLSKDDALDLPTLIFENVHFKASSKYKHILKNRVWEDEIYDNTMNFRHALRCSTSLEDKVKYLTSFLEDTQDNVVVFYNYDEELELMKKEVEKIKGKGIYECNGHKKNYPLKNEWATTKNTVTFANYKSGSEAVEMTYANIIIYFSSTESYTDFVQSIGRCYRNGQTKKVTVYKYITTKTVEESIYHALNDKQDFNFKIWEEQL